MSQEPSSSLSRQLLEAIRNSAVDAIITIDERGRIEAVNPATEQMFGYSSDELLGRNVSILMPSPDRERHDQYLANYLDTGIAQIIGYGREVMARKKSGELFPVHLAVTEIELDDRRLFSGSIRDLTEFRRAQDQEATLGRIIEDSLNEIYIFEADSLQLLQLNRRARENLGYSNSDWMEQTMTGLLPGFDDSSLRSFVEPIRDGTREHLQFGSRLRRCDGSEYDVEVQLQRSTYQSRAVLVAIILDVTERREAERIVAEQQQSMQVELERLVATRTAELEEAQSELVRQEKFATLGKVAGGIAHEIRNPLNAVKMSAYYLLNAKSPSPEKVREHLERIDRQVTMIDRVVTALSDVAKLPEAQVTPTDLVPVIRGAVQSLSLPSEIEVRDLLPAPGPLVLVDESQVVIAFRNLIRNARDAMPEGGVLTLDIKVDPEFAVFGVSDTGTGIPADVLAQILEPLFTTKARGMGLGLPITRAIVEKNQGQLNVQTEVGHGSTFSIRFLRSPNEAS